MATIMSCTSNKNDNKAMTWQEIAPTEIETNAVKFIDKDWLVVSAGNEGDMNLMTISWGGLGELWGRPVFTVYVSPDRYTWQFMEKYGYFTVSHFPESKRNILSYLGSASGRDEDKVAKAGLTAGFTELGNPIFAEFDMAIECRKIYSKQFDPESLPEYVREWYEKSGLGIHFMYIGEIVHVWKK